jgi:hypothetical protein
MPVSSAEYNRILRQNMQRYRGDRDKAVRTTNVATGYGQSTALKYRPGGGAAKSRSAAAAPRTDVVVYGGARGGGKTRTDRTRTASTANPNRNMTTPTSATSYAPTLSPTSVANTPPTLSPTSVPNTPPTLSPTSVPNSPPPGGFVPPMNPALSMASMLRTVPPELLGSGGFPPDLAVSPNRGGAMWESPPPNNDPNQILPALVAQPPAPRTGQPVSGLFGNTPAIDRGLYSRGSPFKLW